MQCMSGLVPSCNGGATQHDPVLFKALHYTWPGHLIHSNKDLKPYWNRRLELATEGQCLLWGTRVVIPNKLYPTVLNELHSGHPGIVSMKAIARSYIWWPGLDKAIEYQCRLCWAFPSQNVYDCRGWSLKVARDH